MVMYKSVTRLKASSTEQPSAWAIAASVFPASLGSNGWLNLPHKRFVKGVQFGIVTIREILLSLFLEASPLKIGEHSDI